ncbi:MAG: hypothetical protein IPN13_18660 [Bacteroidetes bacterium]|nr:hypothetical protein [Bacteroidota bacterium]
MEIEINLDEIVCASTASIPTVNTEFNDNDIYCQNMYNATSCQFVRSLTNNNLTPLVTITPHLVLNQIPASGVESAIQNTIV